MEAILADKNGDGVINSSDSNRYVKANDQVTAGNASCDPNSSSSWEKWELRSVADLAQCADGQLDFCEQCDDHNTIAGDGCSATCEIEPPPSAQRTLTVLGSSGGWTDLSHANDGNESNTAHKATAGTEYIDYSLGGTFTIDRAKLNEDNAGSWNVEKWNLQYWNGSSYVDAFPLTDTPSGGWNEVTFAAVSTTKVRIRMQDTEHLEVKEIQVFSPSGTCGDGAVAATEQCDDGNTDDGDGCSATCDTEYCLQELLTPVAASASSAENSIKTADKAIDGNTTSSDSRWSSAFSDPQWLRVDFGATRKISRVWIKWENAASADYDLQVSNNGTSWTNIYTDHNGNGGTDDITGLSGSGRYLRMYSRARTTQYGNSIYEIRTYGDADPACTARSVRDFAILTNTAIGTSYHPASGQAAITVGEGARINGTLFGESVDLEACSQVKDLSTNDVLGVDTHASYQHTMPFVLPPRVPSIVSFTAGTSSLLVGTGQVVTQAPGKLGDVTVNGTLKLSGGTYEWKSLHLGANAQLIAEAPSVVRITERLIASSGVQLSTTGFDAGALRLTIAGSFSDSCSFGSNAELEALLLVPNAQCTFGGGGKLTGAISSNQLSGLNEVNFDGGFSCSVTSECLSQCTENDSCEDAVCEADLLTGDACEFEGGNGVCFEGTCDPAGQQQLTGYRPPEIARAPLVGPVAPSEVLAMAISLPVRVPSDFPPLAEFARQVSDPNHPSYRHFLTQGEYAAHYQPSPQSYEELVAFVQSYGLTVQNTYDSNELVSVTGTAEQLGQMLFAKFNYYLREDGTQFFAVDREPSLDFARPILRIGGTDNYDIPKSNLEGVCELDSSCGLDGFDFRDAYVPDCASDLDGAQQSIGLLSFQAFDPVGIHLYNSLTGLPDFTPGQVIIEPLLYDPAAITVDGEIALDIEMAHAMAPAASVIVYQAPLPVTNDLLVYKYNVSWTEQLLHLMAHPPSGIPLSLQNSSSWDFKYDSSCQQSLDAMASQGQSFVQSSGDGGAFTADPLDSRNANHVTIVGGTLLSPPPFSPGLPPNEIGWAGSGGGFLAPTSIFRNFLDYDIGGVSLPSYQNGMANSTNLASTEWRNIPDVSMVAANAHIVYIVDETDVYDHVTGGTSVSAPLFAGFLALANQRTARTGTGPIGFANPIMYAIAKASSALYHSSFRDVTSGSNPPDPLALDHGFVPSPIDTPTPPTGFAAVDGYDLVTGLGSPTCGLIDQLASATPLVPVPHGPPPPQFTLNFAGLGTQLESTAFFFCASGSGFTPGSHIALTLMGIPQGNGGVFTLPYFHGLEIETDGTFGIHHGSSSGEILCTAEQAAGEVTVLVQGIDPGFENEFTQLTFPAEQYCNNFPHPQTFGSGCSIQ
jgi:cysteine-rich repeat protein